MRFDHFHIRIITPEDLENYFQLIDNNRKRLENYFAGTVARTMTQEDAQEYLRELQFRTQTKTFFPYAVVDENTSRFAGYFHVMNVEWSIPKAEIGFFADEKYAGKGMMTRALQQLMDHYFNELNFNKLFLRTHPANMPSRALAERCGFEVEGLLRKDYKTTSGELADMLYYGKLKPA